MTTNEPGRTSNPFPVSPVARVATLIEGQSVTVATETYEEVKSFLETFLAVAPMAQAAAAGRGATIVITGEYGTGKTHLARSILDMVQRLCGPRILACYGEAGHDSFLALYQSQLLRQVDRDEFIQRVNEHYADVVAEQLAGSELTAELGMSLRENKSDVTVGKLVTGLGLMESRLREELHGRLAKITENADLASAVTLLTRADLVPSVWEWLGGAQPDTLLQERGIRSQLDSDDSAMEALGALALVASKPLSPFVLVIDEVEKLLSPDNATRTRHAAVLKRLMQTFVRAGGLLVLAGLPEFGDLLPEDARQRVSLWLRPRPLSREEVIEFVGKSMEQASGNRSLGRFSEEALGYVAELSAGNPRRAIRLLYYGYQAGEQAGTVVTPAMLREAARAHFESLEPQDLRMEIERSLSSAGWAYEREVSPTNAERPIDFIIVQPGLTVGCAVILEQSLFDASQADPALAFGSAVQADPRVNRSVLVVNGYLSESLVPSLRESFNSIVVYNNSRAFRWDLEVAVRTQMEAIAETHKADALADVAAVVGKIDRQLAAIRRQVDELQRQAGASAGQMERAMRSALGTVFRGMDRRDPEVGPATLRTFRVIRGEIDFVRSTVERSLSDAGPKRGRKVVRATAVAELCDSLQAVLDTFMNRIESHLRLTSTDAALETPAAEFVREEFGNACHWLDRSVGRLLEFADHREAWVTLVEQSTRAMDRNISDPTGWGQWFWESLMRDWDERQLFSQ